MSSIDGASVVSEGPTTKKYRFKTSCLFITASYVGLFGLITIVIAFSAPYWMSSHKYTYSSFVRLGLWSFCFDHYKHPPYQYDESFTGCRWVYNPTYQNIRDWLQPGWFIVVQLMITLSMLFSIIALLTISIPIMHFCLRYNVMLVGGGFVFMAISALTGFLGWLVFVIKHDTRSWMLNPRFNHLDWAFYLAVLSTLLNTASAVLLAMEAKNAYKKRQRFTNLVYNMHPRSPPNGFESVPLKQQPRPEVRYHPQQHQQHHREENSAHSSPYASISRYSQQQSKSPPHRHSQFTAV